MHLRSLPSLLAILWVTAALLLPGVAPPLAAPLSAATKDSAADTASMAGDCHDGPCAAETTTRPACAEAGGTNCPFNPTPLTLAIPERDTAPAPARCEPARWGGVSSRPVSHGSVLDPPPPRPGPSSH